jgi:hypothetical protein
LPTSWLIANCSYALNIGIDELILLLIKSAYFPSLELFGQFLEREIYSKNYPRKLNNLNNCAVR